MPCALIATELISNAFKNGFPQERKGEITIDLQRCDKCFLKLTVNDNGIGLPSDFELEKISSLGLKLVRDLTHQISGTLAFQNNQGTSVTITFPYPFPPDLE